ncbi:MAG: leucyl aminopeptidase [Actinobacteria bacterium]|nr:MAG: leucyl aminopeptidase [Actinomycetota bacterium]
MEVETTSARAEESGADTIAVGVFEDGAVDSAGMRAITELVESGEARGGWRKLATTHADGRRWIVVGLGRSDEFDAERARGAAAAALGRAREVGARALCWVVPPGAGREEVAGLVEGTLLAAYRFTRYRAADEDDDDSRLGLLVVSGPDEATAGVDDAALLARAQNAARDLQNTPANDLTPARLAEYARELAGEIEGLSAEVEGREGIEGRRMGAFAAVAQGSYQDPALITLRWSGPGAGGPVLGLVGKAVTFDTGGISIKPAQKMQEMKFDMSGGAAVIEAIEAIARLGLPVRAVGVVGATENMPSGRSMRPGDIVRAMEGTSIEINNTDAEGRLILADCLAYAVQQGAERIVDLATLTGGIVLTFGSVHAGLMANDDAWAGVVEDAGRATGELVWRLPLEGRYADMIKGRYADVVNVTEARKAVSITAAEFLHRFVGDVPWAHVDIAGTAYDAELPYAAKGGSGFGVRLLVDVARRAAGLAGG